MVHVPFAEHQEVIEALLLKRLAAQERFVPDKTFWECSGRVYVESRGGIPPAFRFCSIFNPRQN